MTPGQDLQSEGLTTETERQDLAAGLSLTGPVTAPQPLLCTAPSGYARTPRVRLRVGIRTPAPFPGIVNRLAKLKALSALSSRLVKLRGGGS